MDYYPTGLWFGILNCTKRTFLILCDDVRIHMEGKTTNWREPISVEKKVAVALFKLMSGSSTRLVLHIFGIGESTIYDILKRFVRTVNRVLRYRLAWPNLDDLCLISTDFEAGKGKMPHCLGALDGTHIPIHPPSFKTYRVDCVNKKGGFSLILQAIADSRCSFRYIHAGMPGRNHDSWHFQQTHSNLLAQRKEVLGLNSPPNTFTKGLDISLYIIADKAYQLEPWLITPFKPNPVFTLTDDYKVFNHLHSKTRIVIERSFGILKGRFKELSCGTRLRLHFVPEVIHCCAILHNILLESRDRSINDIIKDLDLQDEMEDIEDDDLGVRVYDDHQDEHEYTARLNRESTMDYMVQSLTRESYL
jgi:hypothetical protein